MLKHIKNIGPGAMVAAAFIGPGTITTATLAGASYGYTLLWAVIFSVFACIILQEMTGRLGVIGQMGLGDAIRHKIRGKVAFILSATLVIAAIFVGNAAYESGNISGAVLGFKAIVGEEASIADYLPFSIGLLAAVILFIGSYRLIEKTLIVLVAIIGLVFLIAAIMLKPDFGLILEGMFIPSIPEKSVLIIVGLIGTTVVPYNLFLHASASKKKWKDSKQMGPARYDTIFSIIFGGLITMAILITAGAVLQSTGADDINPSNLGGQLQPLLGNWSNGFLAMGFLAAGLSSAITAPLAASYAVSELLNWKSRLIDIRFRLVWIVIIICGVLFASIPNWNPASVILFAQIANGLLLPIIAIFLLIVMNDRTILGEQTNGRLSNGLGIIVILITIGLAIKGVGAALGLIG